jgi:outer membrane protein assembly factor BamB
MQFKAVLPLLAFVPILYSSPCVPGSFSVALGDQFLWRTPLPNTGQGNPIVSKGLVFVNSHEPITEDSELGSTILGMCFDAKTGKELWRREIPGTRKTDLSSLFNDNTSYSPVVDGERVVFCNVGGTTKCYDYDGKELWSHTWTPFGRHHARAHEPFIHDGKVVLVHAPVYDLPVEAATKPGAHPLGRDKKYWTYLLAYEMTTGKLAWKAGCGTGIHSASRLGQLPNGKFTILTGRGGGHQPPEEPYGISLVDASNGKEIWEAQIPGYPAQQNVVWTGKGAHYFKGLEHFSVDITNGKPLGSVSLSEGVAITRWQDGQYVTAENQTFRDGKGKRPITYFSNAIVGPYHYFRSGEGFYIGRVHLGTGKVEYLQIPVQAVRKPAQPEELLWDKPIPNDMRNSGGFLATQDKRNAGSGWGHVSGAAPTVVGDKIYFPTMVGTVYVLNWQAVKLDGNALLSVSDLGPAGETWSLSGITESNGRLYARTLKELVCLGN